MLKLIKIGNLVYENIETYIQQPTAFDENGNPTKFETMLNPILPNDINQLKTAFRDTLDWVTTKYIENKLREIQEDLSDISSEAQIIEGRILYLAAKEGVSITTDEVKQKITLFITGSYTQDDAVNDLKEKGLSDKTIKQIIPLLTRGVEIAKILNWKEDIWQKEAELEEQIDSMTLEELLQLDVKKLCETAYSEIPLEV